MITDERKSIVDNIVLRLKAKELYGHTIQAQEKIKPFPVFYYKDRPCTFNYFEDIYIYEIRCL